MDPETASPVMIRSWMVSMLENNITSRTVNRKLSTLNAFYHFCQRVGVLHNNPLKKVTLPKTSSALPVFIEKEKMEQLFESVPFESGYEGERDRMMLMLLYSTGIRRAELIGLKERDIDFGNSTIKVLGKRSKERIIPVGSYISAQLDIYIRSKEHYMSEVSVRKVRNKGKKVREEEGIKDFSQNIEGFLFVTSAGRSMGPRQVYAIIHKYLSLVSSQSKLSPHVLRHTFATHMLNEGADLNSIKELLGHTSLAATQVYTHNTIEKLKLIFKQAHPRA